MAYEAGSTVAGHGGSSGFISEIMGFHLNAIAALLVVVVLIVLCLFVAERFKRALPRFLKTEADKKRSLAVLDVIPLDAKRRLTSVSVQAPNGRKALAVILTGGTSDVCLGWLDDVEELSHVHTEIQKDDSGERLEKKEPSHGD